MVGKAITIRGAILNIINESMYKTETEKIMQRSRVTTFASDKSNSTITTLKIIIWQYTKNISYFWGTNIIFADCRKDKVKSTWESCVSRMKPCLKYETLRHLLGCTQTLLTSFNFKLLGLCFLLCVFQKNTIKNESVSASHYNDSRTLAKFSSKFIFQKLLCMLT